eukprot:Skav225162  [mRNA]  locus=scaffold1056:331063:332847:- [translate_table: standard]
MLCFKVEEQLENEKKLEARYQKLVAEYRPWAWDRPRGPNENITSTSLSVLAQIVVSPSETAMRTETRMITEIESNRAERLRKMELRIEKAG